MTEGVGVFEGEAPLERDGVGDMEMDGEFVREGDGEDDCV